MNVAPFVGAWIEISCKNHRISRPMVSLPSWGRGLKSLIAAVAVLAVDVAPFVGAWIEITIFAVISA